MELGFLVFLTMMLVFVIFYTYIMWDRSVKKLKPKKENNKIIETEKKTVSDWGNSFKLIKTEKRKGWSWGKSLWIFYGIYTITIFYSLSYYEQSRQTEKLLWWLYLTILYIIGTFIYLGIKSIISKRKRKESEVKKQINPLTYCSNCGNEIGSGDKFCSKCGKAL